MEQNSNDMTRRQTKIPLVVWLLGIGLIAALIAIFIFNVAVSTVAYYGFLVFLAGGHFFMHGSHGGHGNGDHGNSGDSAEHQHGGPVSNAVESDKPDKNERSGHTGGCH